LGAGLAAALVGLAVASRLQRRIAGPVVALTAAMQGVRESHDYDQTAKVDADDEVGDLVAGFNDMLAEIRSRDEALAAHMAGLERTVTERTADLKVAKDLAEAASVAKSDFLATMSHEIRTPMNGVMVMAEMLAAGELPPKQRRFAEVIAKSGASLLAIINDILDFSKIEAGKLELEKLPADPADLIEDCLALFWERARAKGLDLSAHIDPALPSLIETDPTRLRQVIGNLVNNAIKFTDHGGVLVEARPAGEASLRIYVRDTGVGIPADKLGSVFGAFNQADQTTTRRFGGTGLGLSISKRLVDAMGGRFSVNSTVGRGSTFAFEIPVRALEPADPWPRLSQTAAEVVVEVASQSTHRALLDYLTAAHFRMVDPQRRSATGVVRFTDAQDQGQGRSDLVSTVSLVSFGDTRPVIDDMASTTQAVLMRPPRRKDLMAILAQMQNGDAPCDVSGQDVAAAAAAVLPAFPKARVLVADDSAVNREVALAALGRLGVIPELVNDGRAAVAAATQSGAAFDLILMDGSMPDLDGYDAARVIRAFEAQSGARPTPIIALTAHVVGSAAGAWRAAGMDDVLHKPFTLNSLAKMMAKHLDASASGSTDELAPPPPPRAPQDCELIDQEVYAQIVELAASGGVDFARKIQGLYRDNAPQCLVDLRQTALADDSAAAAAAAHALKSMSYNIGAKRVSALAETAEHEAREGRLPSPASLGAMDAALAETVQYFARLH
ncbi:MAG: ATP-binding protein, partial [Caulobacteraceae bacterium]